MNAEKSILVLGGTGAMGRYLVPKLADDGYRVDVVSLDDWTSDRANLRYLKANAKDEAVRAQLLANHYDGIVDFMIYHTTPEFRHVAPQMLANTDHYIYLSTYRVFDESVPTDERSPRLWDTVTEPDFHNSEDYCMFKARGEDWLRASAFGNWTIIRPAITYSQKRCQLTTLEREHFLPLASSGDPIYISEETWNVQATMSWAGDVAEMIRRLMFRPDALRDDFNVCTAEHHTWGEVAAIYGELFGAKVEPVPTDDYLRMWVGDLGNMAAQRQLRYDRFFNRVMDNRKILNFTGMQQSEMMGLADGLAHEHDSLADLRDLQGENACVQRMRAYRK